MNRRLALLGAACALVVVGAACVPVTPPPPPPPLPAPPPDIGVPSNSPIVTNATHVNATQTASGSANLDHPWDIAFTPDGLTGIVTERGGRISSFDPVNPGPAKLLGTLSQVQPVGESGLLGAAFDPAFPTSPYLYVCASRGTNQIVRVTVDLGQAPGGGLSDEKTLLTGMPQASFHDGCRIRFEPGTSPPALWITMGDAGIGPGPQDLHSYAGKVMRTMVDATNPAAPTLKPYPSNPFGGDVLYSIGHRNPQGLAFQPGTGRVFTSEHGPNINDEVNRLVRGGNAGWDPNTNGGYDQSKPMTDLAKFPSAVVPSWRSGDSFTLAPSGIVFIENVGGADWKAWNGALAVTFLKNQKLRIMFIDGNGAVTGAYPIGFAQRLRSVALNPVTGKLYITTDAGAPNDAIITLTPS